MDSPEPARMAFDAGEYVRRSREGPCFVCAMLAGHPDYPHHDVYEDERTIAFLARYPTLLGYCLVAPKRHVESWVLELDEAEFLALQRVVHRVARAVAATVPAERMYCLSLGSQRGNAHLHWHIAPLPPGVPYHQQQYYALMAENGVLEVDDASQPGRVGSGHQEPPVTCRSPARPGLGIPSGLVDSPSPGRMTPSALPDAASAADRPVEHPRTYGLARTPLEPGQRLG